MEAAAKEVATQEDIHKKHIQMHVIALFALAIVAVLCLVAAAFTVLATEYMSASADIAGSKSTKYKLDTDLTLVRNVNSTGYYSAYIYGNSNASGEEEISSGVTLTFTPTVFEIVIPAGTETTTYASVTLYGRVYGFSLSGPVSMSSDAVHNGSTTEDTSIVYSLSNLTDGTYTLSFTKDEYSYTSTTLGGKSEGYLNEVTTSFTFTVDTTAPTFEGASKKGEDYYYTNTGFTVTAVDASGIRTIYYKTPNSSSFVTYSGHDTLSFAASATNGLYTFYAMDNALNTSTYYYVYLDTVAPVLSVESAGTGSGGIGSGGTESGGTESGGTQSGGSTGTGTESGGTETNNDLAFGDVTDHAFTVSCSDDSGTQVLYYRGGDSGDWIAASGTSITISASDGDKKYEFYAEDAAHNASETYYVTLSTAENDAFYVQSAENNYVYFYWTSALWTATLDGEPYESGTWITSEGDHEIILTSRYGEEESYPCSIDHYYTSGETVLPTCTEQGYTVYECVQCGDTYEADYTQASGHRYIASFTMPTCTEPGYMVNTCTVCGDTVETLASEATGHYFTKTVVSPTCDAEGYTEYTCIVCGYSYEEDYTETVEHTYVSSYTSPTCTSPGLYTYTCTICGDTYTEESGLPTDHTFEITVISSPTCTEPGERYYECTVCGYSYYMEVPATGHTYVILTETKTEDGDTVRVYECPDCGEEYEEDLGNQGEYVASFVEDLFSSYTKYMWWILLAVAGVWSVVMGIFYILARRSDDREKAKRMIVNYILGLVVIAVIIVAAPYLAYGIASLVS